MDRDPEVSLVWGVPFDLFEDPKTGREIKRPHYIFGRFLEERAERPGKIAVIKKILQKIDLRHPSSILRFFKKLNRSNIATAGKMLGHDTMPVKQAWFTYWLETGTIFPDGNICVARKAFMDCFPPYKGGDDVGNWELFFFNLNARGYLSYGLPIPANFGRLNPGQVSEVFSHVNDANREWYFNHLKEFRAKLKDGRETIAFRDRNGDPIQPIKN